MQLSYPYSVCFCFQSMLIGPCLKTWLEFHGHVATRTRVVADAANEGWQPGCCPSRLRGALGRPDVTGPEGLWPNPARPHTAGPCSAPHGRTLLGCRARGAQAAWPLQHGLGSGHDQPSQPWPRQASVMAGECRRDSKVPTDSKHSHLH